MALPRTVTDGVMASLFHVARHSPLAKPTTDLYFVNAMRGLIGDGIRSRPVQPIGLNSFRVGDSAVVVRQERPGILAEVLKQRWRRLIYVIDDDIEAGVDDTDLTAAYRGRLSEQAARSFRPMVASADLIVTGSARLAQRLADRAPTVAIDPLWHRDPMPPPDAASAPRPFRILHAGAISHLADLESILPAIDDVLARHIDVEFVTFADTPAVRSLEARHRVTVRPMRGWAWYRRWIGTERFDLALYPVQDTRFNAARSVNKLIEHALLGAVGVYGASWPHRARIKHGINGFLVGDGVDAWRATLDEVLQARQRLPAVYARASDLARKLNDRDSQFAFWCDTLAISATA